MAPPTNLPVQLTTFVGRSAELAEVQRLLGERRLVTVTGPGGCGKTRLAVEAAARQLHAAGRDGVWWVDLGAVTDPGLVGKVTASALGVPLDPAVRPLAALRSQLSGRCLLLCLDTCEHLLDATAELADGLLRACPGVSVLATSREPLRVAGETLWRVPPLAEADAVRLFADRAARAHRGFTMNGDEEAVRTVCSRLDGIPLAIELAAAWVPTLTPAQIAVGLDDALGLLAAGPRRRGIARHQTLVASIEWSHERLDEADRAAFRRLAVFAGSFPLDAARAVCAGGPVAADDIVTALARLVDKSLLVVHDGGTEARYRLPDTIRQYARHRLEAAGETAATRDRHLDHFLSLAERAEPELERDQDTWRRRLEADHDDFRVALGWGLSAPDPDGGRRLAAALARLWFLHGHTREGTAFLRQAVERAPDDRSPLQARLLCGLAMLGLVDGDPAAAAAAADRGRDIAAANGDDATRARCLTWSAYGPLYVDPASARRRATEARRQAQAAGDVVAADYGLLLETSALALHNRHAAAASAKELLERVMRRGERFCAAFARSCQVYEALFGGDVRRADALASEAVRIAEPLGDFFCVGHNTSTLAWVKSFSGEIEAGRRLLEPLVGSIEDAGLVDVSWMALALGRLHLNGGDLDAAVAWFTRGARFGEPMTDNAVVARALPGLAGALRRLGRHDEARPHVDRAVALARRLDVPYVVGEALDEAAFLVADRDPDRAEDLHHEALALRIERGARTFYVDSLDALAGLAVRAESFAEAVRLAAASDAARASMGYARPLVDRPAHAATLAAARAGLGDDGFVAARAEGSELS
ncbi:MAG TPA: hypothetical protein VE575_07975, partial [Acidimicrobiales bacterium]|nr:hypothetical protein [Acidimicrobiales bacterium]